jgi:hypothetical protein
MHSPSSTKPGYDQQSLQQIHIGMGDAQEWVDGLTTSGPIASIEVGVPFGVAADNRDCRDAIIVIHPNHFAII